LLIICSVLISIYETPQKQNINSAIESPSETAILLINNAKYESSIQSQTTVYDFMKKLEDEGKINFTEKNYIGMGKFIESINGVEGNQDKSWIYYVNDKEAQVGVSNYKIKPGDIVSWKYEKANF